MGRTAKPVQKIETEKPCTCCGGIIPLEDFYVSWSSMNQYTQRMCVCKACTIKLFKQLMNQTAQNTRLAIYYLCRQLDTIYSERVYHSTYVNNEGDINKILIQYMRQINSLPQYKNKTFADSDLIEEAVHTNQIVSRMETTEDAEMSFKVTPEMLLRWGREGRSNNDYYVLEKQYNSLLPNIDIKDARQIMILEEICNVKLEAEIARKGKRIMDYEKLINMISKLMNDAGIKPKDDKTATEELDYSEWIRVLEEDEPVPEASPEFQDVDGIRKYITLWFTRQFARIFSLGKDVIDDDDGGDNNE